MEDMRSPQLPYLTQDLWGCERKNDEMDVYTIESDDLKVTVTPQYAGKVWGIYDKKRQRELLFANRAHQPANIGALKAWAAGGAEWNWSPGIIGHSAFSETQVYLAEVDTERGPMLRVYEFDRYNGTFWQVDMLISNGSFVAHPRITNPTKVDLRGYWWTCVAVDAKPSTRIFTPATHVAQTSRDPMRSSPWPLFVDGIENSTFVGYGDTTPVTDNSYIGNHQIGDMFLRIPKEAYTPYIAHTQEDGYVLVHGHPLNGTKFYTWGQSGPGRFMQDFLAGGGKRQGDYTELQVGPAPTQMQNFPVPKKSIREWTEWFKGFDADASVLRSPDYKKPLELIDRWMKTAPDGMTQESVTELDDFFKKHATKKPSKILVQGQPWGYLEQLRLKKSDGIVSGLHFEAPEKGTLNYLEAAPWLDLLHQGTFGAESLSKLPLSYQTTDGWLALLQESAKKFSMTWLHALHIAIGLAERGDTVESKRLFQVSFDLKPSPVAARCLAVLAATEAEAWPYYEQAWAVLQRDFKGDTEAFFRLTDNLVTEMSFFLQQAGWFDKMTAFIAQVPDGHRELDAFLTLQIKVHMHDADFDRALSMLGKYCFPTYAKARDDLMSMWNDCQQGRAQQAKGAAPLSYVEKHQVRVNNKIPDNIGCQYASKYFDNYW